MKRIAIFIGLLLVTAISLLSQTQTTSTHLIFKNGISTDSIGGYSGDSMIIDGEGLLKFRDDLAGEYTLSELAAGGASSYWQRAGVLLSPLNAGDDIRLTVATEQLQFGDGSNYIYSPSLNNWTFVQSASTALTLGTAFNTFKNFLPGSTSTYNVGDGTHFFNAGYFDRLYLENTNSYLQGATGLIDVYVGGTQGWSFGTENVTYNNIVPAATGRNIGGPTGQWFNNVYANQYIVYSPSSYIARDGSSNMTFTDPITGTKTLAELAAHSDSSWISIQIDTINDFNFGSINIGSDLVPTVSTSHNIGSSTSQWQNTYSSRYYVNGTSNYVYTSGGALLLQSVGNINAGGGDLVPTVTSSQDIGTSILEWENVHANRYYVNTTSNYIYTLGGSLLLQSSGNISFGGGDVVPIADKSQNIGSSTLFWDDAYFDRIYIDDVNTYFDIDVSSNMTFTDAITGTKTLAELAAGGGVSDSSWTSIRTDTITEYTTNQGTLVEGVHFENADITLPTGGDRIYFGTTGNNYMQVGSFDRLDSYASGVLVLSIANGNAIFTGVPSPVSSHGLDIGSSTGFWKDVYADRYYIGATTDYLYRTGLGQINMMVGSSINMQFGGTYIMLGSGTTSFVPWNNKGSSIGSSSQFFDNTYVDDLFIDDVSTSIGKDVSNNITFTDAVTGTKTLAELSASGSGYWDRTGTNLSPLSSGDDILLATGGIERIGWGDGDTQFYESSDDVLDIIVGGSSNWQMTTSANNSYRNILPASNKTLDLGSTPSFFWDDLYIDDIFVDDASTTIGKDGSNNMTFTDAVTGTRTLAQLAAAGGLWTDNGTYLTTTGNEDVRLANSGDLQFGGTSVYITGNSSTNLMNFWANSTSMIQLSSTGVAINTTLFPTGTQDLGGGGVYWDNTYSNRYYVENALTYIDKTGTGGSTDMTFSSPLSGTIALEDLVQEYASFYQSTGAITGVGSTLTTLTVNQTSLNSDGTIFVLSSNQVTVNKSAHFEISYHCAFNSTAAAATEYTMWLEADQGGGFTNVPGTYCTIYTGAADAGSTGTATIMTNVTTGDIFRLRILRTAGSGSTGYQVDTGTGLNFREL